MDVLGEWMFSAEWMFLALLTRMYEIRKRCMKILRKSCLGTLKVDTSQDSHGKAISSRMEQMKSTASIDYKHWLVNLGGSFRWKVVVVVDELKTFEKLRRTDFIDLNKAV